MPPPKTDPVHLLDHRAKTVLDQGQHLVKPVEVVVFAVVVKHQATDFICDRAISAGSCSPKRLNGRAGSARSKPEVDTPGLTRKPRDVPHDWVSKSGQLPDGIEDDFVGVVQNLCDFVISIGHGIGVRFAAKFLGPKRTSYKRRRGGAVHIVGHEIEDRPCGKAFERKQRFRA